MSEQKVYDYLLKVIVVGDGAVGKTALSVRYTEGTFRDDYKMTIGVGFSVKVMNISGYKIKIQIWDTGGQEQFSYVRPLYYKGAFGGLVVFDKTNRLTFDNIERWFKEVYDNRGKIPLILVGNKVDLPDIQVETEEAIQLAEKYNSIYFDASAKSGESVNAVFEGIVRMILDPKYVDKLKIAAAETAQEEQVEPKVESKEAYEMYNRYSNQATAFFQVDKNECLKNLKEALHWAKKANFEEGIRWCEDQIAYISNLLNFEPPKEVTIILLCRNCNRYYTVNQDGVFACPVCSSTLIKMSSSPL